MTIASNPAATSSAGAVRHFARFQLLRLLGKSLLSMTWLVADSRNGAELLLVMPRKPLADEGLLSAWLQRAQRASRIEHPGLALALEVGHHERWPYITYERGSSATLAERLPANGLASAELVPVLLQALQGLAYAHEAGSAHHDLQLHALAIEDGGRCKVLGLGVAGVGTGTAGGQPVDGSLQAQRRAAEADVLAIGLVAHHALSGQPALEQADVSQVIARMPPLGHEIVRLPRMGTQPIDEPLRAIVNRATDRQERQRYRSARTLERALAGWLRANVDNGGGPLALVIDRIRGVGVLPALPGMAARAGDLSAMERKRSDEVAEGLLQDPGLAFELLRQANSAGVRGAMASAGNGPILTVRRAVELLGLEGVRRTATAMRAWPGPLTEAQAVDLQQQIDLARQAGTVAGWLRPPGYDAELVYLLTLLQRLGRLVVQYHFPDEAVQIRRLMQPGKPARPGDADEPGMGEQAACYAVLGVDSDAIAQSLCAMWGLDEEALLMARRLPLDNPPHSAERDAEVLRCTASCANEVVDARALPAPAQGPALHRIAQRYMRLLHFGQDELIAAFRGQAPNELDEERKGAAAPARGNPPSRFGGLSSRFGSLDGHHPGGSGR